MCENVMDNPKRMEVTMPTNLSPDQTAWIRVIVEIDFDKSRAIAGPQGYRLPWIINCTKDFAERAVKRLYMEDALEEER